MNGIRGTRGRKKIRETHDRSQTALICDGGKYFESFEVREDRSITKREHLRMIGQTLLNRQSRDADPFLFRQTSKSGKRVADQRPDKNVDQLGVEIEGLE